MGGGAHKRGYLTSLTCSHHSACPHCTGTYVGGYYWLGSGATVNGFQMTEAEKLQMFERATNAATQGTRVNLFVESNGGGIFHTTYYGN
jgi:hypothetical protein